MPDREPHPKPRPHAPRSIAGGGVCLCIGHTRPAPNTTRPIFLPPRLPMCQTTSAPSASIRITSDTEMSGRLPSRWHSPRLTVRVDPMLLKAPAARTTRSPSGAAPGPPRVAAWAYQQPATRPICGSANSTTTPSPTPACRQQSILSSEARSWCTSRSAQPRGGAASQPASGSGRPGNPERPQAMPEAELGRPHCGGERPVEVIPGRDDTTVCEADTRSHKRD
jgi:hypothetical protein